MPMKSGARTIGLKALRLEVFLKFAEMTATYGKIGTANAVTLLGCKKFLKCWKSTIMSHQIMEMLTLEAQVAIKLHKNKYQCV
jgi:hypothetical protein